MEDSEDGLVNNLFTNDDSLDAAPEIGEQILLDRF